MASQILVAQKTLASNMLEENYWSKRNTRFDSLGAENLADVCTDFSGNLFYHGVFKDLRPSRSCIASERHVSGELDSF